MKGLFDELIDLAREVSEEINKEIEKEKRVQKPVSKNFSDWSKKISEFSKEKQVKEKIVKKPKSIREKIDEGEGGLGSARNDLKTLRDKGSNLEGRSSYLERVDVKKTKLGEYSQKVDQEEDRQRLEREAQIAKLDQVYKEKTKLSKVLSEGKSKDIEELLKDLKSKDRLKTARKAFLYSEIFNRKNIF